MPINYDRMAETAERLITENGRSITLVRPSETPLDSNRPWAGNQATESTLTIPGIQLLPNAVRVFGLSALGEAGKLDQLISISELVYIVFAGEADLKIYTFVRDNGIDFVIEAVQMLKPKNTTVLGFIGVRR